MGRTCRSIPFLLFGLTLCINNLVTFVANFEVWSLRLGSLRTPLQAFPAQSDGSIDGFRRGGLVASDLDETYERRRPQSPGPWRSENARPGRFGRPGRRQEMGGREGRSRRFDRQSDLSRDSRDFQMKKKRFGVKLYNQKTGRSLRSLRMESNLTEEELQEKFRFQIQNPVTLTSFIKKSDTPGELVWKLSAAMNETMLNHIHIAAAFNRLAFLKKQAPLAESFRRSPTLMLLAKQAARVSDRHEFRSRELANLLMSCAALRVDLPWLSDELGMSLTKWIPQHAKDMNPQALANTVYGLGVLDLGDSPEVTAAMEGCANVIPMQLGRFSSMDVAQISWGIGARDGQEDMSQLMKALAEWVTAEAKSLSDEAAFTDLPMIALSFVRLQNWQPKMMDAIAKRLRYDLTHLRLWSLAALLWSWNHPQAQAAIDTPEATKFRDRLKRAAKFKRIRQEDIDRAPNGPKGETRHAWADRGGKALTVVESF